MALYSPIICLTGTALPSKQQTGVYGEYNGRLQSSDEGIIGTISDIE
jgi:hypothetical protein